MQVRHVGRKPVGIDLIPRNLDKDRLARLIEERAAYNRLMGRRINTELLQVVQARCAGQQVRYKKG